MNHSQQRFRLTVLMVFLWIIFFLSGFSSLVYQVAWQRLLTVNYGVGMVSTTLIVSIYMFGLGLGALAGGYWTERFKDKVLLYSLIELGIGLLGLVSFPVLMFLEEHTAGSPYILAGVYEFLFLSAPTILMGMTLPVLIRIFSHLRADFLRNVSVLYFVNTLGAAAGSLIGSYLLISFWGLDISIYAAAGINLALAIGIFALNPLMKGLELGGVARPAEVSAGPPGWERHIPWLVFVTGFLAIGYEIIWFRLIGVLVKCSPYAFSSILTVYLLGIAFGSLAMGRWARGRAWGAKVRAFFLVQIAVAVSVAALIIGYELLTLHTVFGHYAKFSFAQALHPPIRMLFGQNEFGTFEGFIKFLFVTGSVFVWPFFFVFIPTLWIGASFPLISELAMVKKGHEARTVGKVYFFNIVGNVLGGLITGFVLLPFLGSEATLTFFIAIGLLFAVGLGQSGWVSPARQAAFILLVALIFSLLPKKGQLYSLLHVSPGPAFQEFLGEGIDGVVMTYQRGEEVVNYINGQSHGGRPAHAFYAQVVEAASVAKDVEDVLVIGYGTGSITEAVLKMPGVKKVTVVELNTTLMRNLKRLPVFQELLSDPRLEFVYDDGRRFLLRERGKYDLVFMSPLHSTTAYSNNLYSRQFFELVRAHLKSEGLLVSWTDEFEVMAQTLMGVFADVRFYLLHNEGFYISSPSPIRYSNKERPLGIVQGFPPEYHTGILDTGNGLKMMARPLLMRAAEGYPSNQDWRPVGEYYIGIQWQKSRNFHRRTRPPADPRSSP